MPATKAIPKELLPIIDKPLLQYAIEEAINTLIFVTGKNKRAVEDHFDSNTELDLTLRAQGKDKQADMVCNIIPEHVKYIFLRQPERHGLGHVILCAERAVNNKPFTILLADDFIISSHLGDTDKLICEFNNSGKAQLSVMEIN